MTIPSLPRVAVIGCGYWGKNLVRNFHQIGSLALVCDATDAGRAAAGDAAPGAPVSSDVADALGPSIDAVVVATPAETHFALVQQALDAGKDVFVEKPMALDAAEGARLVEKANAQCRILMVGHVLEYHPGVIRLAELVRAGTLGKLHYIYSHRLSLGKVRREENALWSFAPHDIAIILRLVGGMPFQVVACGGAYLQPNIADVTVTSLLFDNGVRAHIHVSWLHPFKEQRLVVVGSQQMAVFDDVNKSLLLYDQRVDMQSAVPRPLKAEPQSIEYGGEEPLRQECSAFIQAIQTRRPPLTDGGSGLRVLRVLQAAQRSLVTNGEPVGIPMECFEGGRR